MIGRGHVRPSDRNFSFVQILQAKEKVNMPLSLGGMKAIVSQETTRQARHHASAQSLQTAEIPV